MFFVGFERNDLLIASWDAGSEKPGFLVFDISDAYPDDFYPTRQAAQKAADRYNARWAKPHLILGRAIVREQT